jgi:hypothetical protein
MTRLAEENRSRQLFVGVAILLVISLCVCGTLIFSRSMTGLLGEWLSLMIGILTTPFFMEASFVILGLVIVIGLNTWRRRKEGEELVYLERVDDAVASGLPDHASWAVYDRVPLPGEVPSLLVQAEGAMAIGDHALATELIGAMSGEEMKLPAVYELRIALAKATGRENLAGQLQAELEEALRHRDA